MILFKKLIFAPIFLILLSILFYFTSPLLQSTGLIFSLDMQTFYKLITLSALILTSAMLFVVFASLSLDWKFVLPTIIVSALTSILLIPMPLSLTISPLIAASLLLNYLRIEGKMTTYLTFKASDLLSPSVKQLAGLLIITLSITYYLSINQIISQKGFEIPDSLIDSTLKFVPSPNLPVQGFKYEKILVAQLPQITPEQIELLKQNPQLLKQYGIDPKMLDSLSSGKSSSTTSLKQQPGSILNPTTELVKPMIKQQLQNMIKPYLSIIPGVLALLLFLTLQSFVALLGIFLPPVIWLIFYILEKTNFIHFEKEMREVRKMVV